MAGTRCAATPVLSHILIAGLLAGYGVAIPVGAIGALPISLTARTSLRTGIAAALGVATVDGGYALVAVLGGGALRGVLQQIAEPMRWAAAAVLAVIAVRTAVFALRPTTAPAPRPLTPGRAYTTLVGLTALNLTTIVYFGTLVLGRQTAGPALADAVFVLAAFVASASWQLLLVCGGGLLGRVVDTPKGRLITGLTASAVILVLAVRSAW
jgi:arginine exporter protein ArgO